MESSMVVFDATKSKEMIEKEIAARKAARANNAVEHRNLKRLRSSPTNRAEFARPGDWSRKGNF